MDNEDGGATMSIPVYDEKFKQNDKEHKLIIAGIDKIDVALFGADRTDGLVSVVRELQYQNKLVAFVANATVGVISAVATSLIIMVLTGVL